MIDKTHLWPEERSETDDTVTLGVTIENSNNERSHLWYRVPLEHREAITGGCEPFVLGALFMAMSRATNLVVHGQVSPSLLRNLEEFQNAWACWRPEWYTKIEITADRELELARAANSNKAIMAFSGGVDASFTAWSHRHGQRGRLNEDIGAGVMIHGFDIPLDQVDDFCLATEKSAKMLASLGMALIPVATNFRELDGDWEDAHGAGLASCLTLFQDRYVRGVIASSEPYNSLVIPWGSNPITDPLLSSNSFRLIHDGAAFTRSEKIRRIAQWPEALQHLRVCWQGKQKDRNCGRCEKCVRTILNFRVMGLGLPACFEQDITDQQILNLKGLKPGTPQFLYLEEILSSARTASISESWVTALERCLHENRLSANGQRSFRQQLKKRVPLTLRRSIRRLIGKDNHK